MSRSLPLLAGLISLSLSGGPATAKADTSAAATPPEGDGVVTLFGHRLCLPQAARKAGCDWRMPGLRGLVDAAKSAALPASGQETAQGVSSPPAPMTRFTLLGHPFCVEPGAATPIRSCPRRLSRDFELLGVKFCSGHAAPGCDVTLPAKEAMHAHR